MTAAGQTFNSFLGRAKAKYSEFQQNQQQRQAENAHINARESNWGNEPQSQTHFGQQQNQWSGSAPGGGRGGAGQGMWERYVPPLYPYRLGIDDSDDRSISESFDSESTSGTPAQTQARPVTRPSPGRWQPGDTYGKPPLYVLRM